MPSFINLHVLDLFLRVQEPLFDVVLNRPFGFLTRCWQSCTASCFNAARVCAPGLSALKAA